MYFSGSAAVGLGFAAHAAALLLPALPAIPVVGKASDSIRGSTTVTLTTTTTAVTAFSSSATISANSTMLSNATMSANSTISTNSSRTSFSTTFATLFVTSDAPVTRSTVAAVPVSASVRPPASSAVPTTPPTSGLTPDQQAALDLHNTYRAQVGCSPLAWDNDLANSAQAWANHLTTVGSLQHDQNPGGQGENLAMQTGGTFTYVGAVQLWMNEKSLYNGQPISAGLSPNYHDYGHYTQAVWKSTQKVGLALVTQGSKTYVVARYLPAGNYIGQMPY